MKNIRDKKLKWFRYIMRKVESEVVRIILKINVERRRKRRKSKNLR